MEVCSSTEMGALGASHLGTGDHGDPKPTEADHDQSRVDFRKTVLRETTNCCALLSLLSVGDKSPMHSMTSDEYR
jgi:hypothetical protein